MKPGDEGRETEKNGHPMHRIKVPLDHPDRPAEERAWKDSAYSGRPESASTPWKEQPDDDDEQHFV